MLISGSFDVQPVMLLILLSLDLFFLEVTYLQVTGTVCLTSASSLYENDSWIPLDH